MKNEKRAQELSTCEGYFHGDELPHVITEGADGRIVAQVDTADRASLLASAPRLVGLLAEALPFVLSSPHYGADPTIADLGDRIDAAIAKAENQEG